MSKPQIGVGPWPTVRWLLSNLRHRHWDSFGGWCLDEVWRQEHAPDAALNRNHGAGSARRLARVADTEGDET